MFDRNQDGRIELKELSKYAYQISFINFMVKLISLCYRNLMMHILKKRHSWIFLLNLILLLNCIIQTLFLQFLKTSQVMGMVRLFLSLNNFTLFNFLFQFCHNQSPTTNQSNEPTTQSNK